MSYAAPAYHDPCATGMCHCPCHLLGYEDDADPCTRCNNTEAGVP